MNKETIVEIPANLYLYENEYVQWCYENLIVESWNLKEHIEPVPKHRAPPTAYRWTRTICICFDNAEDATLFRLKFAV